VSTLKTCEVSGIFEIFAERFENREFHCISKCKNYKKNLKSLAEYFENRKISKNLRQLKIWIAESVEN
jgi:hypothetical protein